MAIKLEFVVARAMWEADERPCLWTELSSDEHLEWVIMARAAIDIIMHHCRSLVKNQPFPSLIDTDCRTIVANISHKLAMSAFDDMARRNVDVRKPKGKSK